MSDTPLLLVLVVLPFVGAVVAIRTQGGDSADVTGAIMVAILPDGRGPPSLDGVALGLVAGPPGLPAVAV